MKSQNVTNHIQEIPNRISLTPKFKNCIYTVSPEFFLFLLSILSPSNSLKTFHNLFSTSTNYRSFFDMEFTQFACNLPINFQLIILLGRTIANGCQWAMILYAATYPNSVISPPVILALGTVIYFISTLDAMIDLWRSRGRR